MSPLEVKLVALAAAQRIIESDLNAHENADSLVDQCMKMQESIVLNEEFERDIRAYVERYGKDMLFANVWAIGRLFEVDNLDCSFTENEWFDEL